MMSNQSAANKRQARREWLYAIGAGAAVLVLAAFLAKAMIGTAEDASFKLGRQGIHSDKEYALLLYGENDTKTGFMVYPNNLGQDLAKTVAVGYLTDRGTFYSFDIPRDKVAVSVGPASIMFRFWQDTGSCDGIEQCLGDAIEFVSITVPDSKLGWVQ